MSVRRSMFALLLACACAGEPVRVKLYDDRGDDLRAMTVLLPEVVEACDFWGIDCIAAPHDRTYGTLLVAIEEDNSVECGRQMATGICRKSFKCCPYATAIAHEIGHAFGLGHSDDEDEGNVMWLLGAHHDLDDLDATAAQVAEVSEHVGNFNACK